MKMAAKVGQIIVNGCQFLLQHATHLTGCVGGCLGSIGFDEVNDGFRLRQIQFAVEESSFGKLATLGRPCPGDIQRLQSGCQHSRRAVAVEFHCVFSGVAVWPMGINGAAVFAKVTKQ